MNSQFLFKKYSSCKELLFRDTRILGLIILFFLQVSNQVIAQQAIPLYKGAIPNSIETPNKEYANNTPIYFNVTQPSLTIYLPQQEIANGTAVIICPGGGYEGLWMKNEGWDVAEKFNKMGIAAFVLKYRLPSDLTMKDKSIGPLQDVQRAIQVVRQRSFE